MDTFEESLVCRDEREPIELALSKPPAVYLSSSFLLSFLELREKNDLPPEDCLDLLSPDMIVRRRDCFDYRSAPIVTSRSDAPSLENVVVVFICRKLD